MLVLFIHSENLVVRLYGVQPSYSTGGGGNMQSLVANDETEFGNLNFSDLLENTKINRQLETVRKLK